MPEEIASISQKISDFLSLFDVGPFLKKDSKENASKMTYFGTD